MKRILATLVLYGFASVAAAQAYPQRPVHMIIPFAPGGASDFVGRIISPRLSELLGQQIVIENRAGASGNIGVEAAAKAPADGYNIFLGNVGTIAINPTVLPLPVNPARDFIAISQVADVPSILIAHTGTPANTVAEFVALGRSKPGALNFGSPGSSTVNRLEMEQFMRTTGIKMVHVPYKGGAGPAVTGLLGGETHVMFITLVSASSFVKAGRLKAYAVTTQKRFEGLPDVPTMIEAGYPDMVSSSWQGVFVPAGTPRAAVMRLHAELARTLETADVRQRYATGGAQAVYSRSPEEFAAFVNAEMARWGKLAKDVGATID
jgi:tripartite-type tricarboxylate transporter receptor subunit TctC